MRIYCQPNNAIIDWLLWLQYIYYAYIPSWSCEIFGYWFILLLTKVIDCLTVNGSFQSAIHVDVEHKQSISKFLGFATRLLRCLLNAKPTASWNCSAPWKGTLVEIPDPVGPSPHTNPLLVSTLTPAVHMIKSVVRVLSRIHSICSTVWISTRSQLFLSHKKRQASWCPPPLPM